MKRLLSMKLYVLALLLSGCSQLGIPTPDTFNQRLAVALSSVTAVRETTTTLLKANKISAADAQHVQNSANNIREGLDIARQIAKLDPRAGDDKLAAVSATLRALQAYIATKEKS